MKYFEKQNNNSTTTCTSQEPFDFKQYEHTLFIPFSLVMKCIRMTDMSLVAI